ncbi:uncharacterized protein LOC116291494 [Actinia tenebrosa]|uniref:Uncharacterized protein LOC116291494 n=1 Tax=Actinia tenebrosa TaxID=6105 RepID=A0A6P8HPE1_ACTTE|nr:uncharacterized protein LOC116291494 [Actinia tenebrosa]
MPLNIGTFPRQENGETFFDGIIPPLSLQKMKELYQGGNKSVHKYISENCTWVSEVKEFDLCDASGTIHVNVHTNFGYAGVDGESVKGEIRDVLKNLSSCSNCILTGNADTCTYNSLKEPCTRCKTTTGNTDNEPCCVSALCIHVSSDQASAQRKAHMEMNETAERDMNSPNYRHFGFGLLHFCENCISSLRHYRLTDMSETFYVGLLSSVWASNTSESAQMKKATPATVFSYRDAHSDEICFQTVSRELEIALLETKAVVATLIPEQYKPTAVEAKTHSILGRPLYIASNANGDILWTDAEFEYVGMGNRHIPTKFIALGQWDSPGPAQKTTVTASNATFSHPAGIDVMIIKAGKCEVAFVSDKGNSTIRFIRGVETFNGNKFVGTLKLQQVPRNWKPEGLAVVDTKSLAVTARKSVYIIALDDSLTSGQVISLITNLQSPHGLCVMQNNTLLVADEHCVKQIDMEKKSVNIAAQGFKKAFDVAVSDNGTMGVTDVHAHQITLFKKTDSGFDKDKDIGTGTAGCLDGPATKAQLSEPTGLCFDCNTAIFCCFGGKQNGYIKLHTTVGFACQFMNKIRQIYDAIGFLPKKVQKSTEQHYIEPYREGVDKLVDFLCYMEQLISARKEFLSISPAGPEETVYHLTVKGFSETVSSLEVHIQALEVMGMTNTVDSLNLSAFVNESRKEHGFAKHKQSGHMAQNGRSHTGLFHCQSAKFKLLFIQV